MSGLSVARTYRYRATELATGRHRQGEQSGESAYAVRAALARAGLQVDEIVPVLVEPAEGPAWLRPLRESWLARQRRRRRLARADLLDGLATLLDAGLPLEQAVGELARAPDRGRSERRMLRALRERLREGQRLSDACERHGDWFDRIDSAMLAAGQHGGELAPVLHSLAELHQQRGALAHRFVTALAYPALLSAMALVVALVLSRSILPDLVGMIVDAGKEPPALTMGLIATGEAVLGWWPLGIVGAVLLVLGGNALVRHLPRDAWWSSWWQRTPLVRARRRGRVARLALTLARLLRTGMPLVDALEVAASTSPERRERALLMDAAEAIRRGEDFSAVVERSGLFESSFAQVLRLGEQAGELPAMLERIGARYAIAAERAVERLAAVLEPVAVLVIAGIVGLLAIAAVLPLVQLGDLV